MKMPQVIKAWIAVNPEKVADAFTEMGDFFDRNRPEHWVYLKGWRNDWVDPVCPIHLIHEPSAKEAMFQLRRIKPCVCESCQRGEA